MILVVAACIVAVFAAGFLVLELDARGHRSARYLVPAFLSAILIAVLVGINRGLWLATSFFSTEALAGFLAGCVFMGIFVAFIMWIDPDSRPRGSSAAANQKRPRDFID